MDRSSAPIDSMQDSVTDVLKQLVQLHPVSGRLEKIAEEVKDGKTISVTPRELLQWFGAQRRGVHVVQQIRDLLEFYRLVTVPDFAYEYIDGVVTFTSAEQPSPTTTTTAPPASDTASDGKEGPGAELLLNEGLITTDPTYRIGKLPAANHPPLTVRPSDSIDKAVTLMMQNDYSQLPVLTTPSSVEGLFTWESLAIQQHFGRAPETVAECTVKAYVISSEVSIFDAVTEITRHNVVLVRAANKMITGIVTTFDLSHQFRQLGEPFLLLGEIENQVRRLLDNCFSLPELQAIRDEKDPEREIQSISDLTLGEYLRLIENPKNWTKLALPLDRPEFVKKLDEVRVIRNSVMHFDTDPMPEADLGSLRKFAHLLQQIADVKHAKQGS